MPTYYPRGVSAQLAALPLNHVITEDIVNNRRERAKAQSKAAEKKLYTSTLLFEVPVAFPGDQKSYRLNWLGNAPFMQSKICRGSVEGSKEGNEDTIQALVLHLKLSDTTFRHGLSQTRKHLKIEVFFNAQLSNCLFVPYHDIRNGTKPLHLVFGGTRVDYLAERPWVLLPSEAATNDEPEQYMYRASVRHRWENIGSLLLQEADARGRDNAGGIPPTAEFLKALATMAMPEEVHNMQRLGSEQRRFGVIDVVVTAGFGKKNAPGLSYLTNPQGLLDERYVLPKERVTAQGSAVGGETEMGPETLTSHRKVRTTRADMSVTGDSIKAQTQDPIQATFTQTPTTIENASLTQVTKIQVSPSVFTASEKTSSFQDTAPVHSSDRDQDCDLTKPPLNSSQWAGQNSGEARLEQGQFSKSISSDNLHTAAGYPLSSNPQFPAPLSVIMRHEEGLLHSSGQFSEPARAESRLQTTMRRGYSNPPLSSFAGIASDPPSNTTETSPTMPSTVSSYVPGMDHPQDADPNGFGHPATHSTSSPNFAYNSNPWAFETSLSSTDVLPTGLSHTMPVSAVAPAHPFHHRPNMLPPTGYYSVPKKPEKVSSLLKMHARARNFDDQQGKAVKRLRITGRDKAIIVDHTWSPPKYLSMPSRQRNKDLTTSITQVDNTVGVKHSGESMENPAGLSNTILPSDLDEDRRQEAAHSKTSAHKSSQHGNTTQHHIFGAQGPKATPFWFEDPEEILREAAKLRRSISPNKKKSKVTEVTKPAKVNDYVANLLGSASSSPLSSAPTTPEFMKAPQDLPSKTAEHNNSPNGKEDLGHAAGTIPSLRNKDDSPTATQLSFPMPTQPPVTLSPSKREAEGGQSNQKQARDADRVKAVDNLLMNKNCVIAYAENEDRDGKSVLRQIKGERQGFFEEDYVVFAARIFVPAA